MAEATVGSSAQVSKLTCTHGSTTLWVTRVTGITTHVAANENLATVATTDGSVHVFNPATGTTLVHISFAMNVSLQLLSISHYCNVYYLLSYTFLILLFFFFVRILYIFLKVEDFSQPLLLGVEWCVYVQK